MDNFTKQLFDIMSKSRYKSFEGKFFQTETFCEVKNDFKSGVNYVFEASPKLKGKADNISILYVEGKPVKMVQYIHGKNITHTPMCETAFLINLKEMV